MSRRLDQKRRLVRCLRCERPHCSCRPRTFSVRLRCEIGASRGPCHPRVAAAGKRSAAGPRGRFRTQCPAGASTTCTKTVRGSAKTPAPAPHQLSLNHCTARLQRAGGVAVGGHLEIPPFVLRMRREQAQADGAGRRPAPVAACGRPWTRSGRPRRTCWPRIRGASPSRPGIWLAPPVSTICWLGRCSKPGRVERARAPPRGSPRPAAA